ncbi:hypothetical protein CUMW_145300 [Citrus unshiu]|nr:hypothetical protein CUMW_145300 [Citrus unshiu]
MEFCMEARAFKPSLRRELSCCLKSTQQVFFDDIPCVSNEDFSVDDLLDFSNGDFEDGSVDDKDYFSSPDPVDDDNNSNSGSFSSEQSLLTNEFVEPVDDFAELEWVSQFVDDSSCSELSLLYPNYVERTRSEPNGKPVSNKTSTNPTTTTSPCFPLRVPSKARTKRTRRSGRAWSSGSPLSTESTISSSSSTSCLIFTDSVQNIEWFSGFDEPVVKKPKKKPAVQSGGGLFQRRCSHCQTQKTPQWRTGPLGPKTLCNACGVRYKSGRLFPEYRPACSPTFSVDMHSNSHRKVLEMRRKKESAGPDVGLSHMVQSF